MLSGDLLLLSAAPLFCVAYGIIMQKPEERARPLRTKDVILIGGGLLVFILFFISLNHFLPENLTAAGFRILQHPGFLLPVWFLVVWRDFRNLRSGKFDSPAVSWIVTVWIMSH
jgi:surface polysaccharide O-acyltransferase-like enzyme